MRSILKVSLFLVLGAPAGAVAQILIPVSVSGNEARAAIALPGEIAADLTITFEDVVGLTPAALEVSASLVSPADFGLLGRLPGVGEVSVPASFPVLLRIAPSASSALTFAGVATISLYTQNLQLDRAVPLALYKSPDGGPFSDITTSEGIGSYRAGGSTGDFSEFLIVIDNRPIDTVIGGKFDTLQAILTEHATSMRAIAASTLQTLLSLARTLYESGETLGAIGQMRAFSQYVKARGGQDIPDVWRAHDETRVNVAGLLRSGADTLKFSLDRKASR